jgi:serine protease Do
MIVRGCGGDSKYQKMVDASVLLYDDYSFGSGVFINDNVILTAAHVLSVPDLKVELNNGVVLDANDFYIDEQEDVGFIFIDADELNICQIAKEQGEIGDKVYLVGSPYSKGFVFTITKGILSHLNRNIYGWEDLIQVDAEAAPGSSGGPLYNSKGELIGICVGGENPGGGVTLCESIKSIQEAYKRCKIERNRNETNN